MFVLVCVYVLMYVCVSTFPAFSRSMYVCVLCVCVCVCVCV